MFPRYVNKSIPNPLLLCSWFEQGTLMFKLLMGVGSFVGVWQKSSAYFYLKGSISKIYPDFMTQNISTFYSTYAMKYNTK